MKYFPGMTSYGMLLDVVHHKKEKKSKEKKIFNFNSIKKCRDIESS